VNGVLQSVRATNEGVNKRTIRSSGGSRCIGGTLLNRRRVRVAGCFYIKYAHKSIEIAFLVELKRWRAVTGAGNRIGLLEMELSW